MLVFLRRHAHGISNHFLKKSFEFAIVLDSQKGKTTHFPKARKRMVFQTNSCIIISLAPRALSESLLLARAKESVSQNLK